MNNEQEKILERMIKMKSPSGDLLKRLLHRGVFYHPTRYEAELNCSPGETICYRDDNGMWFCLRLD